MPRSASSSTRPTIAHGTTSCCARRSRSISSKSTTIPSTTTTATAFCSGTAIDNFAHDLEGLRDEMTAAGLPASTPIYLGEYNNDAGKEGKQSVSIVNGLYVGQMLGTLANAGVPMSTFWLAYGSCDQNGDFSKKLYGWQNFGTEALFSDGATGIRLSGRAADPGRHAVSDGARDGAPRRRSTRRLAGPNHHRSAVAPPGRARLRLRRRQRLRVRASSTTRSRRSTSRRE